MKEDENGPMKAIPTHETKNSKEIHFFLDIPRDLVSVRIIYIMMDV